MVGHGIAGSIGPPLKAKFLCSVSGLVAFVRRPFSEKRATKPRQNKLLACLVLLDELWVGKAQKKHHGLGQCIPRDVSMASSCEFIDIKVENAATLVRL